MIKLFRLATGEFMLGKVTGDGPQEDVYIKNPRVLQVGEDTNGQPAIALVSPVGIFAKTDDIFLTKGQIVFSTFPVEKLENAYQEQVGDIITPTRKLVI